MVARLLVAAVVAATVAGAARAAVRPPAVSLREGETRWYAPGRLAAGDAVECTGRRGTVRVPVAFPVAGTTRYHDAFGGGVTVSVGVRPNGAVEIGCGSSGAGVRPRPADLPYLIGRNGLGLIRGTNTLARVRALFGPSVPAHAAGVCRVEWPALGLAATFAGTGCPDGGVLRGATVTGRRWSSLDGVHLGDSVGRLSWEDQGARRIGPGGPWLLGGTGSTRLPRLLAVVARGRVARLVLQGR